MGVMKIYFKIQFLFQSLPGKWIRIHKTVVLIFEIIAEQSRVWSVPEKPLILRHRNFHLIRLVDFLCLVLWNIYVHYQDNNRYLESNFSYDIIYLIKKSSKNRRKKKKLKIILARSRSKFKNEEI